MKVLFKGEQNFFGKVAKPRHAKFQVGLIPITYFVSFENFIDKIYVLENKITLFGSL